MGGGGLKYISVVSRHPCYLLVTRTRIIVGTAECLIPDCFRDKCASDLELTRHSFVPSIRCLPDTSGASDIEMIKT